MIFQNIEAMLKSKILENKGVYIEKSFNGKWCYKYQPPGKKIIIISDYDKENAASKMIKEIDSIKQNNSNGE